MKQASRSRWTIVFLAAIGIVGGLVLGVVGYWQYVTSVPPFTAQLPLLPRPNGYDRAVRAISQLSQTSRPRIPARWPDGTSEELRVRLAAIHPVLDKVRASFALDWRTNPPLSFSATYPELAGFRECARSFAAESILARNGGDFGGAMQRSLDAVELGARVPRGGGMLRRLVGRAIHAIGFSQAEQLVSLLPADRIPEAVARVRRVRKVWPTVPETLESERITTLAGWTEFFQETRRQPLREQIRALDPLGRSPGSWQLVRAALTPRRIFLASVDRYYRQWIAESKKPFRRRVSVPKPDDPWSQATLVGDVDPWFYDRAPTQLALLEVALAVRLYRLERGRYPATLGEIRPEWLREIPVDLWGQPVAYRLKDGQPLIYSLGPDGKDDGGQAADPITLSATTRGDLVLGKLSRRLLPSTGGGRRS